MTDERIHTVGVDANDAPDATADIADTAIAEAAPAADAASAKPHVPGPRRPAGVPEKFWNVQGGTLRTDALLKSYLELERKLGSMIPLPTDEQDAGGHERLRRAIGVPDAAEDYAIEAPHAILQPDPEVNAKLHDAGFTQRQAQLVYDLAAGYMLPLIDNALADVEASRDAERLATHFGGEEAWRTLARQIKTWSQANLPEDAMQVLSSSYDGILAMHQMMQAREPSVLRGAGETDPGADQGNLAAMMRDPRYWREREPAFVAEVTEGFKRLYSD